MGDAPLSVMLACNFSRDERIGTSRVPLRLAEELERLGWRVSLLFADDLPRVRQSHGNLVTAPARMAYALARQAPSAEIVDVAGFDAWMYARLANRIRPRQAIVSRSNGLWYKALAVNGTTPRGRFRALASDLFQKELLCRWERASIRSADLVLFGARGDGEEVVRQGWKNPAEVAVVAPGVDEFFASSVSIDHRRDVAFVGGFLHRKGNDIVATAMSEVLRKRPQIGFTLFGTGLPAPEVLSWFEEAVRPRIRVIDSLSSEELAKRLGTFAILVFPTRYEGFGLVVLEAMRAGLAVVTTPTGAGADVLKDGTNGLVVPVGDVAATAAAVLRLCDDLPLRRRLAGAAVEEAQDRSWTRTAMELAAAYRRASENAARRATS